MYNQEIKERYIIEKEHTTNTPKGYLARQFNKIERFENKYNKDLSNFTVYEIVDMYKTLNIGSLESVSVLNSHFSLYTQWCLHNNLVADFQNHFSELSGDDLLKCVNKIKMKKSIITRKELESWISQLQNPSEQFILLALFEGLKGNDFCELTSLKISDFEGNKVKLVTGRELTISNKLLSVAKESAETYIYYAIKPDSEKSYMFLPDKGNIIKDHHNVNTESQRNRGRRVYSRIIRSFIMLGVDEWMKPNSLVESGKIYYIKERAKELGITPIALLNRPGALRDISERFGYDFYRQKSVFIRKYKEYLV